MIEMKDAQVVNINEIINMVLILNKIQGKLFYSTLFSF